ncbi:hypothetical protein ERICI_00800 [Paenibacillus larvae subsp. larvae]|uniref:Uncharacterized protein n=1 Tax=Paenibacillus larvae subsp. larvae TaxID=147375 RepID=A0A2L1TX75_9BACL|nr:hypothetical protein ERICI_00800 [Paenibacillus larvae subsp. larvae]AVG13684.1 hypothetical protein ERICII_03378 [Paenibacillus larvae subsp. larvae DSM 25430]ETK28322.1 hypothetical protein ERIC1_1c17840 [Paenibacillus larvae subsp. larvae DSM 25719]AVF25291.1 hypothetical protein ERICIII_01087 [Paenibacillus larvae subsp. larvae]AVF30068.1 hypothetical protein ERICIV_01108 [Paenibacillus larvae subsp. larvae]
MNSSIGLCFCIIFGMIKVKMILKYEKNKNPFYRKERVHSQIYNPRLY